MVPVRHVEVDSGLGDKPGAIKNNCKHTIAVLVAASSLGVGDRFFGLLRSNAFKGWWLIIIRGNFLQGADGKGIFSVPSLVLLG